MYLKMYVMYDFQLGLGASNNFVYGNCTRTRQLALVSVSPYEAASISLRLPPAPKPSLSSEKAKTYANRLVQSSRACVKP